MLFSKSETALETAEFIIKDLKIMSIEVLIAATGVKDFTVNISERRDH